MNKRIAVACFIAAAFLLASFTIDNDFIEGLKAKLWRYLQEHPTTNLHVHTDKNIYSPVENIWFKAYVLSGSLTDSKVLYVRLADKQKHIVAKAVFPVYDLRSNGELFIPDTLKDGNYFFYAFTDRMTNFSEEDVFVQPITVHRNKKKWQAEAYVLDSAKLKRGEKVEILVRLKEDNNFVKGIKGKYQLFDGNKMIRQRGIATNNIGEAYIDFTYPAIADTSSLVAKIVFENETDFEEVNLNLRHEGNLVSAAFFPEGGHFVQDMPNNLAIQVKDIHLNPVITPVVLKQNNVIIAKAVTNASGVAMLRFTPKANENYITELDNYGVKQMVPFKPLVEAKGYIINALIKDNICRVQVANEGEKENIFLVARSFDQVVWGKELKVPVNGNISANIPVNDFTGEMLSIDLLNTDGKLMAERLVMNLQEEPYHVAVKTAQESYGLRKKVTVTIDVTAKDGTPAKANCSVAVVEKNTVDDGTFRTIQQTSRNKNTGLAKLFPYNVPRETQAMNELLLTQQWNNYNWDNMLSFAPKGKLVVKKNADGVCGVITAISKRVKELPVNIIMLSNAGIVAVPVAPSGYFFIRSEDLEVVGNKTKLLVLNNDFYDKYDIVFKEYDADFDRLVLTGNQLELPVLFNNLMQFKKTKLDSVPGIKRLDEVIVHTSKPSWIVGETEMQALQQKLCNSYVCINNILNCPNHKMGTPPIEGRTYRLNGHSIVYTGCFNEPPKKTRIPLKKISLPSEFIEIDYDKNISTEPEVRTTLYWNPNIYTDKNGKTSFSFFTNDIKSGFKIIVEGVTVTGMEPVQGSCSFTVK